VVSSTADGPQQRLATNIASCPPCSAALRHRIGLEMAERPASMIAIRTTPIIQLESDRPAGRVGSRGSALSGQLTNRVFRAKIILTPAPTY
jgi:hypothetical protein